MAYLVFAFPLFTRIAAFAGIIEILLCHPLCDSTSSTCNVRLHDYKITYYANSFSDFEKYVPILNCEKYVIFIRRGRLVLCVFSEHSCMFLGEMNVQTAWRLERSMTRMVANQTKWARD